MKNPIIEDVLLEPFSIEVDPNCYVVYEKQLTRRKNGTVKESLKGVRYPRTLDQAIAWIVREKVRRRFAGAVSLREFQESIIKEARDVKSVCDHV